MGPGQRLGTGSGVCSDSPGWEGQGEVPPYGFLGVSRGQAGTGEEHGDDKWQTQLRSSLESAGKKLGTLSDHS